MTCNGCNLIQEDKMIALEGASITVVPLSGENPNGSCVESAETGDCVQEYPCSIWATRFDCVGASDGGRTRLDATPLQPSTLPGEEGETVPPANHPFNGSVSLNPNQLFTEHPDGTKKFVCKCGADCIDLKLYKTAMPAPSFQIGYGPRGVRLIPARRVPPNPPVPIDPPILLAHKVVRCAACTASGGGGGE